MYLFGHPGVTWIFSKLKGLQGYFPENFRCNLMFHEFFFIPGYITFSNPKSLGFLYLRNIAQPGEVRKS